MTEGRNPQMTRATTSRGGTSPGESGWGATTNTAGTNTTGTNTAGAPQAPAPEAPSRSGIGAKLAGVASSAKAAAKTGGDSTGESGKKERTGRGSARAQRQPRRARLTLSHVNVYSVFKFSCVLAIALFLVWLIVVGVLYGILDVSGALDKINSTVKDINGDGSKPVVSGGVVFGAAIIIGVVNIVLFIALSTVGAMIYNLCADLVGGAEVTLSERS
jgi:hypothetical protein